MNQPNDDELPDALRDLAEGTHHTDPPAHESEHTMDVDAEVDEPNPEEQIHPEPTRGIAARNTRLGRTPTPRWEHDPSLSAVAGPILVTVGGLLMIPAIWGTLLLLGVGVWRSDAGGARAVAAMMLVCYPLGGLLAAAGGYYIWRTLGRREWG